VSRHDLDSGAFWERCISDMVEKGLPDGWRKSVFDGEVSLGDAFIGALAAGATVLDFGCGVGRNALALARRGFDVLVCDVADAGVRFCEEWAEGEGLAIRSVTFDGHEIDLASGSVDGLLAWSCLDHVTLSWAHELAGELGRVARPGAILLVSFDEDRSDDPESVAELLGDGSHHYIEGRRRGMIFRPYTNREILALFEHDWERLAFEGRDASVPRRGLFQRRGG
jgi:2-polyprenyl-3-methyl-5-hydroxy-6-metoxy-1,4-benzoquinol methylase